jgi:hypothetical protein
MLNARDESLMKPLKFRVFCCLCTERQKILPSGTLQIVRVVKKDEGVYRCSVVNPRTGERRDSVNTYHLKVNGRGV